jgi:hypothetical protein
MKKFKCFFLILLFIPALGQEADSLIMSEVVSPIIDLESIADTIIYEQDTILSDRESTFPAEVYPDETSPGLTTQLFIMDVDVYNFSFSGISWHLPKDRVEWLLEANQFVKLSDTLWITQAADDSLLCYPYYRSDILYGFHVDYLPEKRADFLLLERYKKIVRILTEKYGNPGKVTVLETRWYVPERKFYTHSWKNGKESLTTSINRAEKKIELIYSIEADTVKIKKNELDKRLNELF